MFDRPIAFHARFAPRKIAFATQAGEVTYAAFDADIDRVADRFQAAFPGGTTDLAQVSIGNPYAHWLALLALARLGIASTEAGAARRPTLVITDQPVDGAAGVLHASQDWFRETITAPRPQVTPVRRPPEGLARLMYSSGTTGTPRGVAVGWEMLDFSEMIADGLYAGRQLTMLGPDTIFGVLTGLMAWARGGTFVYCHDIAAMADLLPSLRPTGISLATGQLAALLDRLPADHGADPALQVTVAGSPVSRQLAERTLARLAGHVLVAYGSSEALTIAKGPHTILDTAPDAVGYVLPGREVEIVDEAGHAVPAGAQGEIRVRRAGMRYGYLDDPDASARVFRDGWFHPGDIGRLMPDGLLCVSGRVDEVMNVGGIKMLPHDLEAAARTAPGVADAAMFPARGGGSPAHAYLAVVRGEGFDEAALKQALHAAAPAIVIMIVWAEVIPRNAMAKVDRRALAAAFAASQH